MKTHVTSLNAELACTFDYYLNIILGAGNSNIEYIFSFGFADNLKSGVYVDDLPQNDAYSVNRNLLFQIIVRYHDIAFLRL